MAPYTVLVILCQATFFSFTEQSVFRNLVNCPCGNSGKNITVHVDKSSIHDACSKWANCKSCKDGLDRCLECPEGFEGITCTKERKENVLSRKKRQSYPRYPSNGSCRDVEPPKVGSVECILDDNEKTCTGTCAPGHTFENRETEVQLSCQNGVWIPSSQFPKCKSDGYCELTISDGSYNCTIDFEGTHCDVYCSNRYTGRYNCFPGQAWNPTLPQCIQPKGDKDSEKVPMSCPCLNGGSCDRYGNCICTVGRTGKYCESIMPEKRECGDPGFISNGVRRITDLSESIVRRTFEDGEWVMFGCRSGEYVLQGSTFLTCNDGAWSRELPKCIKPFVSVPPKVMCPDPGQVSNADRLNSDGSPSLGVRQYQVGQTVAYSCHPGFSLQPRSIITCLETGRWSHPLPYCTSISSPEPDRAGTDNHGTPKYCLNPGSIKNGKVVDFTKIFGRTSSNFLDEPEYIEGTRVKYACERGYTLQGSDSLVCEKMGLWSASVPNCIITATGGSIDIMHCDDPGPISDGEVNILLPETEVEYLQNAVEFPEGTRLEYSCESGFILIGDSTLLCQTDGYWSSSDYPFCSDERKR